MVTTPAGERVERHTLTIGTRASKLALAQADIVRAALLAVRPGLDIRLETITTKGDAVQDRPLAEIGGDGLFVRQIEVALREGSVDLAVHSAKDLPSLLPEDMALPAFLPRADPRDVLVSRGGLVLTQLPPGSRVGTSSPRRACQVAALRPDLTVQDIRGNVDTRLRKLGEGQYDAIVLAAAGLARLGLLERVAEYLDPGVMLPAIGQGALAVECRAEDAAMIEIAAALNDSDTEVAVTAERAFLAAVGAGCSTPVAAHATLSGDTLRLTVMLCGEDGRPVMGRREGDRREAALIGREAAAEIIERASIPEGSR